MKRARDVMGLTNIKLMIPFAGEWARESGSSR